VDFEKQGQAQIIACSGAYKHGSLKVIRNGIGIEDVGTLEGMQELSGIWALRSSFESMFLYFILVMIQYWYWGSLTRRDFKFWTIWKGSVN
jgi:hypothetical protein